MCARSKNVCQSEVKTVLSVLEVLGYLHGKYKKNPQDQHTEYIKWGKFRVTCEQICSFHEYKKSYFKNN